MKQYFFYYRLCTCTFILIFYDCVFSQNIVIPSVLIGLLGNGVNALLHWLLVYKLDLSTE